MKVDPRALHEAAHCVALLDLGGTLDQVVLGDDAPQAYGCPRGIDVLGGVTARADAEDAMTMLWAGAAAELRMRRSPGWTSDAFAAVDLLRYSAPGVFDAAELRLVAGWRPYRSRMTPGLVRALYDRFGKGARELVRTRWPVIRAVAGALQCGGSLTGDEVGTIISAQGSRR